MFSAIAGEEEAEAEAEAEAGEEEEVVVDEAGRSLWSSASFPRTLVASREIVSSPLIRRNP